MKSIDNLHASCFARLRISFFYLCYEIVIQIKAVDWQPPPGLITILVEVLLSGAPHRCGAVPRHHDLTHLCSSTRIGTDFNEANRNETPFDQRITPSSGYTIQRTWFETCSH